MLARWRVGFVIAVVLGCVGLVACGSGDANSHAERYLKGEPHAVWAGRIGPMVAKLTLSGDGSITFLVVECRPREPQCHEVGYYTERSSKYGPGHTESERLINEGPRVDLPTPVEHDAFSKLFDLPGVGYSCKGSYAIAVVNALLRQPQDIVTDRSSGVNIRFKKAQIPMRFHPEGVLVYGLLPAHASTIVVKTPDGRVVARQREMGAEEEPHFKGANTRVGSVGRRILEPLRTRSSRQRRRGRSCWR